MKNSIRNILLVMCLHSFANAQGLPTVADVKAKTYTVMELVVKGDIEAGLKAFKPLTIIPTAEFDAMVGQAVNQMPLITSRFGASLSQEFIKEVKVGQSLAELVYIHRFDKHAMRWQFFLYRGKDGWVINTFRFDDQWPLLLEQK